jgi:nitroreductase
MDFFEVVEKRQSVRKYAAQPIEPDKLNTILQAANRAPSAGNFQAYEIYVVNCAAQQKALTAATFNQDFVGQAPLSLVFCMNPSRCQYSPPLDIRPGGRYYCLHVCDAGGNGAWPVVLLDWRLQPAISGSRDRLPRRRCSGGHSADRLPG